MTLFTHQTKLAAAFVAVVIYCSIILLNGCTNNLTEENRAVMQNFTIAFTTATNEISANFCQPIMSDFLLRQKMAAAEQPEIYAENTTARALQMAAQLEQAAEILRNFAKQNNLINKKTPAEPAGPK